MKCEECEGVKCVCTVTQKEGYEEMVNQGGSRLCEDESMRRCVRCEGVRCKCEDV